jgi:hypothetical protein
MADNQETSNWEAGIYQLETTDQVLGGAGGVSNRPNVELGNRTARLKTILDLNGVYVIGSEHAYGGQNVDVTADFKSGVVNGDVVQYVNGNLRYEKITSLNNPLIPVAGIADVTNGRVIAGGLIYHNNIPASNMGSMVYASASAGQLTVTPNGSYVGRVVWKTGGSAGVISMSAGSGGTPHSYLYDDEADKHFTEGSILHSAINNDQMNIHASLDDLIGHVTLYFAGESSPLNFLECNGSLMSKAVYADLYAGKTFSIGGRFGESGPNFYLPDFRGRVPRGYDHGIGRDPDRLSRYADRAGGNTGDLPGSMQDDEYQSHRHPPAPGYGNFMSSSGSGVGRTGDAYGRFDNTGYIGGNETRMKNFSGMWVIRYQ